MLGQEAVFEKSNEITAIPALIERLDLKVPWSPSMPWDATPISPRGQGDYLLAVKDNQPTLHADVKSYFDTAPATEIERHNTLDKGHGRLEQRRYSVSKTIDWIASDRSYPGAPRFPQIVTIAMVESQIERGDKIQTERRSYISSRDLSA
jgi:predicted transposase YbfD/YdcC